MKQLLKIEWNENIIVKEKKQLDEQKMMQSIALGITNLLVDQQVDIEDVDSVIRQYRKIEAIGALACYLRYHDSFEGCYLLVDILLYEENGFYKVKVNNDETDVKLAVIIYAIVIAKSLSAKNQQLLLFSLYCLFFEQGGDENG